MRAIYRYLAFTAVILASAQADAAEDLRRLVSIP